MYLTHLSLTNFRNYIRLELDLPPGVIVLQGLNAQGKTKLLEAIAYLATARSLLSSVERELVHWLAWEEPLPFARLAGELTRGDQRISIRSRGATDRPLREISEGRKSALRFLVTLGVPILVILFGLIRSVQIRNRRAAVSEGAAWS